MEALGKQLDDNRLAIKPGWEMLLRHLEFGEGFAFIVLLVPDSYNAVRYCELLAAWLAARQQALALMECRRADGLRDSTAALLSRAYNEWDAAVWLEAVVPRIETPEGRDHYQDWLSAWEAAAQQWNRARDQLSSHLNRPLLCVGAPWVRELLRDTAPDLWSVRTLVAELPSLTVLSPPHEPSSIDKKGTREYLMEYTPDPALALRAAESLRQKPGLEAEVAEMLYRAGIGQFAHGQFEEAKEAFTGSIGILETLAAAEPGRTDYQSLLAYCFSGMGDLMSRLGAWEEARGYYQTALEIRERLVRQEPWRAAHQRHLAAGNGQMGDVMGNLGAPDQARGYYQRALGIIERLVQQEPDRADYQWDLAAAYSGLGDVLGTLGAWEGTRGYYRKMLEIRERLVQQEPNRADYQRDLAVGCGKMGDLMGNLGVEEEARAYYQKALEIAEHLVGHEPWNDEYQHDLATLLIAARDTANLSRAQELLDELAIARHRSPAGKDL